MASTSCISRFGLRSPETAAIGSKQATLAPAHGVSTRSKRCSVAQNASKDYATSIATRPLKQHTSEKLFHPATRARAVRRSVAPRSAATEGAVPEPSKEPAKPAKVSKPRLPALDSVRFFLIAYIATGHFIATSFTNPLVLKLFTQINVVVGAFFVLSGYVAGYVATELGKYEASPRIEPAHKYIVSRIFGYYPLYFFTQLLFGAMFVYADNFYNGPVATAWHAFLTFTLSQAWFPAHAELWNAPTWFLSALTFAMVVMPFALPSLAKMTKRSLKQCLLVITGTSLIAKLAYSYDLGVWTVLEGITRSPNMMFWNMTRFHPFYAVLEVLMGVAACRLVMLDGVDGDKENEKTPASPLLPLAAMIAVIVARATGYLTLNDPLTRVLIFLPMFTLFIMRIHRETVYNAGKGLSAAMAWKPLVYLGTISFPIYIIHGPLGQLFYKKVIATKIFGGVMSKIYGPNFFFAYMGITLLSAAALHQFFIKNKTIQGWSGSAANWVASFFEEKKA